MDNSRRNVDVSVYVRTCLVNGFQLDGAQRSIDHFVLHLHGYDHFGVRINYSIAIFADTPSPAALDAFTKAAEYEKRYAVVVAPPGDYPCVHLDHSEFLDRLGGPIDHAILLDERLPSLLSKLGNNGRRIGHNQLVRWTWGTRG